MENRHYHIFANGKRIEIPSPQVWEYVGDQDKPIKQIDMKNKKHKVKISKDKVVIKPTPGHEIDEDLICKINRHYEHDGIFKPIKKELPKLGEEYLRAINKCFPTINPVTISELNKINTIKNEDEHDKAVQEQASDECIGKINDFLKRYWHKIDNCKNPQFIVPEKIQFECDAFDKAKELFEKNGIGLYYYSPRGMLTIKKI